MSYQYENLEGETREIRLIRLAAGCATASKETVQCVLEIYSLDTCPPLPFVAISYCWGISTERRVIAIGGRMLNIPASAEEVLRFALHTEGSSSYIWIDAICIDQSNLLERNRQVALMGTLYSRASRVLVWLGNASAGIKRALVSIHSILGQCQNATGNGATLDETLWGGIGAQKHYLYSDEGLPSDCNWRALEEFFASRWFTRMWPIQEVCLAKEASCYYGEHVINWRDVALSARWMYHRRYWLASGKRYTGVDCASEVRDTKEEPMGLYALLQMCIYFDATDPRDKIYGLLGLIPNESPGAPTGECAIVPDYTKSLKDVYTAAARVAVAEGSLTVLGRAVWYRPAGEPPTYPNDLVIGDFPSWVPRFDWHWDTAQGSPAAIVAASDAGASAGLPLLVTERTPSHDILRVCGMFGSEVVAVGPPFTPTLVARNEDLAMAIKSTWSLLTHLHSSTTSADLADRLLICLCAGTESDQSIKEGSPSLRESLDQFVSTYDTLEPGTDAEAYADDNHEADKCTRLLRSTIHERSVNRCIIAAANGTIGLGPPGTRPGDAIVILFGAIVPYILQKQGNGWKLVGDAYVEGMMEVRISCSFRLPQATIANTFRVKKFVDYSKRTRSNGRRSGLTFIKQDEQS
jgi:hypothetical protein